MDFSETPPLPPYRLYPLGDQALTIDWGNRIDPALNATVHARYRQFCQIPFPGLLDLIPAYSSLTLVYDTSALLRKFLGRTPYAVLSEWVAQALEAPLEASFSAARLVEIPVCYDPAFAPDLEAVAGRAHLTTEATVRLHSSLEYRVYMLGFLPGFAYLGRVPEAIAAPRLATPRTRVPAGSVGIAGEQTGIYPQASPGGWNLIGRTPLRMFDARRGLPSLLQPGDRVRFYAITPDQFHQILAQA